MKKSQEGSTLFITMIILVVLLIFCLATIRSQILTTNYNTATQLNTIAEASSISALNEAFLKLSTETIEVVETDDCYKNNTATNNKVLVCPVIPKYLLPSPPTGEDSLVRNAREYGVDTNKIGYLEEQPRWYVVGGCNVEGFTTSGMNRCDTNGTGDYLMKIFSVGSNPLSNDSADDLGYVYTVEYAYVRK